MPEKILVTYASRSGSTAGVAEAIAKILAEEGEPVDVRSMNEVADVTPYRAVVAGSAIQGNRWLPEAMQFIQTHRVELNRRLFAAFLVCMTLAIKNGIYGEQVKEFMQPVRARVRTVSEGCFAGILDISKVPTLGDKIKFQTSVWMGVWTTGDHRDWEAVRAWAKELKSILAPSTIH
jgi:menaquinone-dependent protoporphyrinogen oxidase